MDMCKDLYQSLQVLESEDKPLSRLERLKAMNGPLLSWYEKHARILPWREKREAYGVWISEIMLQQTRVEAVKPYFKRFLEELPQVEDLAQVEEERLLKLWEGLGYYNRARNLKKTAQIVVKEYGGKLPASYDELIKLPGIGSYTAGAIASIAYQIPVPAVDGNVLRVVSRVLAVRDDILKQSVKRGIENDLRLTMPKDSASSFNQGLIEIGAMVCVPNGPPKCTECPLESICLARKEGLLGVIPYKAPKKPRRMEERTVLLIEAEGKIAIKKRSSDGLLASLYEFPNFEGIWKEEDVIEKVSQWSGDTVCVEEAGKAKHIFSHVEWHMTGYRVQVKTIPPVFLAVEKEEIFEKYPLPNAFCAYTKLIRGES